MSSVVGQPVEGERTSGLGGDQAGQPLPAGHPRQASGGTGHQRADLVRVAGVVGHSERMAGAPGCSSRYVGCSRSATCGCGVLRRGGTVSAQAVGAGMPTQVTLDDLAARAAVDENHRYELSPEGVLSDGGHGGWLGCRASHHPCGRRPADTTVYRYRRRRRCRRPAFGRLHVRPAAGLHRFFLRRSAAVGDGHAGLGVCESTAENPDRSARRPTGSGGHGDRRHYGHRCASRRGGARGRCCSARCVAGRDGAGGRA